jgi:flagellum-specific ATP synthase
VGVRCINGLLTLGRGQRVGLFAGSGVGKSVLLGMITRQTEADVIVVGLIGERGREVREFIEHSLGPEGMRRAIVVVAPADEPALMRMMAAELCHTIAAHFRDQGLNVLLLLDSLTRYAMARRELRWPWASLRPRAAIRRRCSACCRSWWRAPATASAAGQHDGHLHRAGRRR